MTPRTSSHSCSWCHALPRPNSRRPCWPHRPRCSSAEAWRWAFPCTTRLWMPGSSGGSSEHGRRHAAVEGSCHSGRRMPVHDRAVIRYAEKDKVARRFLQRLAPDLTKLPPTSDALVHASRLLTRRTFTLQPSAIQTLKRRTIGDRSCRPAWTPSTFEALAAHCWVSRAQAKNLTADAGPVFLLFLADLRALLDPPPSAAARHRNVGRGLCAAAHGPGRAVRRVSTAGRVQDRLWVGVAEQGGARVDELRRRGVIVLRETRGVGYCDRRACRAPDGLLRQCVLGQVGAGY